MEVLTIVPIGALIVSMIALYNSVMCNGQLRGNIEDLHNRIKWQFDQITELKKDNARLRHLIEHPEDIHEDDLR